MARAEIDATSLGAKTVAMPPDLIVQVPDGAPAQELSYQEAIREALREEMVRDERVFLLGEDIGKHGGAFGVTRTLFDQFGPERVRNTVGCGDALLGAFVAGIWNGLAPREALAQAVAAATASACSISPAEFDPETLAEFRTKVQLTEVEAG